MIGTNGAVKQDLKHMFLWLLGLALLLTLALALGPSAALAENEDGQDRDGARGATPKAGTILYEITETVKFTGSGVTTTRDAVAVLLGSAKVGTPLCPAGIPLPPPLPPLVDPATQRCTITAMGTDVVPLATGIGPVSGTFSVVVNAPGNSSVHIPDLPILTGTFQGTNDLSLAVLHGVPLGFIRGVFTVDQTGQVLPFSGTFRLPFAFDANGQAKEAEDGERDVFYLGDDGRLIEVRGNERVLGLSPVRLELTFN